LCLSATGCVCACCSETGLSRELEVCGSVGEQFRFVIRDSFSDGALGCTGSCMPPVTPTPSRHR
jgi:hypothetical protein